MIDSSISKQFQAPQTVVYSIGVLSLCGVQINALPVWKLKEVSANTTAVDEQRLWAAQSNSLILVIPERVFQPFNDITFEVSVQGYTSIAYLTLKSLAQPPVIQTDSSNSMFYVDQDLVIDASESYDPNQGKLLSYVWQCEDKTNQQQCTGKIDNTQSNILKVPKSTLTVGLEYEFTLACSYHYSNKIVTSQAKFEMTATNFSVPKAYIGVHKLKTQPTILSAQVWNRLTLYIEDSHLYNYTWSMQNYSFPSNNFVSVSMPSYTLVPRRSYTIIAKALQDGREFIYSYSFYVNIEPQDGSFSAILKDYSFNLLAKDWIDFDGNNLLLYSYGYTVAGKDYYLNIRNQSTTYHATFPASKNLNIWVEIHDSFNDFTRKSIIIDSPQNPKFEDEQFIDNHEYKILDPKTKYFDLPFLISDLNVNILNKDLLTGNNFVKPTAETQSILQRAFQISSEGIQILINSAYEFSISDVSTIINLIEDQIRNPFLVSTKNVESVIRNVNKLLQASISKIQMPTIIVLRYTAVLNNCVLPTQEFVYQSSDIFQQVFSTLSVIFKHYSKEMIFTDVVEFKNPKLESRVQNLNIENLNQSSLSVSGKIYFSFPANFSQSVSDAFTSESLFITTTIVKADTSEQKAVPYVTDQVLYDYQNLNSPSLRLDTNITISIPISKLDDSLDALNTECVFINVENNQWDTTGCFFDSFNDSSVICKCNHLTSFSAGDFFQAASDTLNESNAKDPYNLEVLKEADGHSLAGLYISGFVLLVYSVCFLLAYKFDRRDAKQQINQIFELEGIKNKIEEIKIKVQQTQNNEAYNVQPQRKAMSQLVIENHHMISPFMKSNTQILRQHRCSLFFIGIFGKLFFLGLFYQHGDDQEVSSMQEAIMTFSLTDFWKIIFSIVLMLPLTLIITYLLTLKPRQAQSNIAKYKIKVGCGICWLFMIFCCWNIMGFVIAFPKSERYQWMFSSLCSVLFGITLVEPAKIVIIQYILLCFIGVRARMGYRRTKMVEGENYRMDIAKMSNQIEFGTKLHEKELMQLKDAKLQLPNSIVTITQKQLLLSFLKISSFNPYQSENDLKKLRMEIEKNRWELSQYYNTIY